MEKHEIDEILNKMFEIKEENGEKMVKFRNSKQKNVSNTKKRRAKSNSVDVNGEG